MKASRMVFGAFALVLLPAWLLSGCNRYGEKASFGEGEIYYKKPVKKSTVDKVGKYLLEIGYFSDKKKKSVQLLQKGSTYQIRFVVKDPKSVNHETKEQFRLLGGLLSHYVLDGAKTEVHLCDRHLKGKQTLSVPKELGNFGKRLAFDKSEIFYKPPVKEAEAKKLGDFLKEKKFFVDGKKKSVQVAKVEKDGSYDVRFVMQKNQPANAMNLFKQLAILLSKQVFNGVKVNIHFCDAKMVCHTKL